MHDFIGQYFELEKKDSSNAARFALQELRRNFDLRSNHIGLLVSENRKFGYYPLEPFGSGSFYRISSGHINIEYLLNGSSFIILEKDNARGELREVRTKEKINLLLNRERRHSNAAQKELLGMYGRLLEGKDI